MDWSHLLLWRLDLAAFLRWLADGWRLRGGVRAVDDRLWQLGTHVSDPHRCECFFSRAGPLSAPARQRLHAYRTALVLYGLSAPSAEDLGDGYAVSLLEVLHENGALYVTPFPPPPWRGAVRFDVQSGALWAGDSLLGEVPVGSREFFFLEYLASHRDRFVAYADIKHHVLLRSGSTDATEEATFCQGLKSRIKKKWVPAIDRLIVTTNKGDGYRLRGATEL